MLQRRSLLAMPLLLAAPAVGAGAVVPPFPDWVGRTARLRGDGAAARLLLAEDGGGLISVRLLFFCRPLPIREWHISNDGAALRYARDSALHAGRLIQGEARIDGPSGSVRWIEAESHLAEFDGFEPASAAGRCG